MGPDNIDIIVNELDALFNIDLNTGTPLKERTHLNIVRMGTSGAIQEDIPVDSFILSTHGIGLDGLIYFYEGSEKIIDHDLNKSFLDQIQWPKVLATPYIVAGNQKLLDQIGEGMYRGITLTSPGFYGPQGRSLRVKLANPELNRKLAEFRYSDKRIINYEMETAALYGLGRLLEHNTATACVILANRATGRYSSKYNESIKRLVSMVLERLTA
jgi:uridine phosphorylase